MGAQISAAAFGWNINAAGQETSKGLGTGKKFLLIPGIRLILPVCPFLRGSASSHISAGAKSSSAGANPEFPPQEDPTPLKSQRFLLENLGENRKFPKMKQGKGVEGREHHMDLVFLGTSAWILPGKIKTLQKIRRRMRNMRIYRNRAQEQEQGTPQTNPSAHPGKDGDY